MRATEISTEEIEREVEQAFPAPGFRENQKEAIVEVVEKFLKSDAEVVKLSAPTGAGKSLLNYTIARVLDGGAYMTTPLNTLVDQMQTDEFIGDELITIKGRNNYECIHPDDMGTRVDEAKCQRESEFDCSLKSECPYYGKVQRARNYPYVATNMSYIMAGGLRGTETSEYDTKRGTLVVDECQKIEDFAMNFISVTVGQRSVPENVWKNITVPPERREDDMEHMVDWVSNEVLNAAKEELTRLGAIPIQSTDQSKDEENLEQFIDKINNFLTDVEENAWTVQIEPDIRKNKPNRSKAVFKPVRIGRFLKGMLWNRGDKILLSSATIPGGDWLDDIGLGDKDVETVSMPSTFPVENRPIVMNHDVGKMTYKERDKNFGPMAEKIRAIAEHHEGEKGFIHCRSYGIAESLERSFKNTGHRKWFNDNCMMQDKFDREESLERWIKSDKQIFFSVAMDEGVDLDGDKCSWQVLAKVLYMSMADKRVKYRMGQLDYGPDKGDWDWYNRNAAIQIQQAYGRAVRSEEDEAVFYMLDSSAKTLIKRNAGLFNQWFLEAIDDMNIDPSRGV